MLFFCILQTKITYFQRFFTLSGFISSFGLFRRPDNSVLSELSVLSGMVRFPEISVWRSNSELLRLSDGVRFTDNPDNHSTHECYRLPDIPDKTENTDNLMLLNNMRNIFMDVAG